MNLERSRAFQESDYLVDNRYTFMLSAVEAEVKNKALGLTMRFQFGNASKVILRW
jgi:hypothetical protein